MSVQSAEARSFDLIVIGSGFGALFFVEGFLRKKPLARVLVLERGAHRSLTWQIANGKNSAIAKQDTFRVTGGDKQWNFTIGLGGGTNCWWGQTPRFHPSDFKLQSLYGVSQDWPLSYAELEPYYVAAEQKMSVAGGAEMASILPRSAPFPLPAHNMTAVDKIMCKAQPDYHVPIATARASVTTAERARCCASANCTICRADAKFTFNNGFKNLMRNLNVEFRVDCEVTHLDVINGQVSAVIYRSEGRERRAQGDLCVLGANAIHSPAILLRSGITHPLTGKGINEQYGYTVEVLLDGLDNFDGSTVTTALNYLLYDGEFRKQHGGALIYFENRWLAGLRKEYGRWRQTASIVVVGEDLPQEKNRVEVDAQGMALVHHEGASEYAKLGAQRSFAALEKVLAPLPVEAINFIGWRPTESHIQGSLRMGTDRATSVVDATQVHHDVRNLVVVGSSVFPSCPSSNPSLSVAALSLRSADLLTS